MRSAEIAKALGLTRNNVLQALEQLQMLGYISTTKDGYARYRSTKITSKTKLILND
jgi:Mn-dependent DtxR family transcriptional regulator